LGDDDARRVRAGEIALDTLAVHPPGFEAEVALVDGGWRVQAKIAYPVLGADLPERGVTRWRASFCRYDARPSLGGLVLSSTSPHEICDFHRRHEWRPLCF
jgi:hypothetical protein